jgi:hyperosmotically inducible protein
LKRQFAVSMWTLMVAACAGSDHPAQDPSSEARPTSVEDSPRSAAHEGSTPGVEPDVASRGDRAARAGVTVGATDTMAANRTPNSGRIEPAPATTAAADPKSDVGPTTSPPPGAGDGTSDATNTRLNERDRHGTVTPGDQGGSDVERKITAAIRREIVGDKSLSFTAKNVKIITSGGKVTLRGPVKSADEKTRIETHARQTDGVTDVDNQLEIKN